MRLVSMLDEAFDTIEKDPAYTAFTMDGQVIPAYDYLEIRPEKTAKVQQCARDGRFVLGPWYVLPDEWLVCGESLVRNLHIGKTYALKLGASPSRAGFVCDIFGHTGQLPQIFDQMNIQAAFPWRGTNETDWKCNFNWKAPDGTAIPARWRQRQGCGAAEADCDSACGIRTFGKKVSMRSYAYHDAE